MEDTPHIELDSELTELTTLPELKKYINNIVLNDIDIKKHTIAYNEEYELHSTLLEESYSLFESVKNKKNNMSILINSINYLKTSITSIINKLEKEPSHYTLSDIVHEKLDEYDKQNQKYIKAFIEYTDAYIKYLTHYIYNTLPVKKSYLITLGAINHIKNNILNVIKKKIHNSLRNNIDDIYQSYIDENNDIQNKFNKVVQEINNKTSEVDKITYIYIDERKQKIIEDYTAYIQEIKTKIEDIISIKENGDSNEGTLIPSSIHLLSDKFELYITKVAKALRLNTEATHNLRMALAQFKDDEIYKFIYDTENHLSALLDADYKIRQFMDKYQYINMDKLNNNLAELQILSLLQKKDNSEKVTKELIDMFLNKINVIKQNIKDGLTRKMTGGSYNKYLKYKNKYISFKINSIMLNK